MKNDILFTVIMPAYNVECYIAGSINSVLNQSYKNFELLVIDDGSTDHTSECVEHFSQLDKRVKLIKQTNSGPAKARNNGMDNAVGDYIVFVDSDDLLDSNALFVLKETIENNDKPDVVVFGGNCYPSAKKIEWVEKCLNTRNVVYNSFSPYLIFKENGAKPFIWQSCIKIDFLNKNHLRINEELILGEDQAFQFAYFPLASKVVFIKNKLYNYRTSRSDSLMAEYNKTPVIKYVEHFKQVEIIIDTWKNNGMFEKYYVDLFNWIIQFLGEPILALSSGQNKIDFSLQLVNLVNNTLDFVYVLSPEALKIFKEIEECSKSSANYEYTLDELTKREEELKKEIEDLKNSESYKIGKFFSSKNN